MVEVAFASMPILPTFPPDFARRLDAGSSRAMLLSGQRGGVVYGDAAGKAAGGRFASAFKNAAKLGVLGGGFALFAGAKESTREASDLNESLNAVRVTYGKYARDVIKLGNNSAKRLGLSRTEFQGSAVQFSNFANTISGGKGRKAIKTIDDLTRRGSDFASVFNLDVDEAMRLFQSGLAGETEPLRRFGIDMSANATKAEGLAMGMQIASEGMTETQKVQARYSLLMKSTSKTQDDFKNTSDQLANQQRILGARFDNTQAKVGKLLLPVLNDAVTFLNRKGIPAFKDFLEYLSDDDGKLQTFIDRVRPLADETLPAFASAFGDIRDFAKDALPYAEDLIEAFNDLPEGVKKGLIIGGGALAANRILTGPDSRGPRSTLRSGIRSGLNERAGQIVADRLLARFQRPIPVIVMNPGFSPKTPDTTPDKGGGFLNTLGKGLFFLEAGRQVSNALPEGGRPFGPDGFLNKTGLGRENVIETFTRNSRWNPFGDPKDIDKTARAFQNAGTQIDANRTALKRLLAAQSTLDKTPREVDRVTAAYERLEAVLKRLSEVGAGGLPNTPGEATPRGFGADPVAGAFAGANINVTANSTREIADALRKIRRNAARGGV
jgi:hypothetical protein